MEVPKMTVPKTPPQEAGTGAMRSPNFPAISLPDALKKVKVIYDADGRTPVSSKVLLEHLGYGEKMSGAAGRMVSALRQFGLLTITGDKSKVSDDAFHVLTLSDAAPVRKAAIVSLAKKPAIFREVLAAYPERLPSDSALRDYLITEKKFNPASVETFVRALKGTLEFAKLYEGGYTGDDAPRPGSGISVGDHVQWESQGVLQFDVPRKVTAISPDGAYVQVEGSHTGIPMDQVSKADSPTPPPSGFPPPPSWAALKPPLAGGVAREVFSLEDGEAVLQWPTTLDAEGVEELEDWLALVVKKLKRLAKKDGTTSSDGGSA
jgi:hypothetical protein